MYAEGMPSMNDAMDRSYHCKRERSAMFAIRWTLYLLETLESSSGFHFVLLGGVLVCSADGMLKWYASFAFWHYPYSPTIVALSWTFCVNSGSTTATRLPLPPWLSHRSRPWQLPFFRMTLFTPRSTRGDTVDFFLVTTLPPCVADFKSTVKFVPRATVLNSSVGVNWLV
jgi:hypothetical protein